MNPVQRKNDPVKQSPGFTLLEMMIVVIILGILSSIALPRYIRMAEKGRAAEATHNLGLIRNVELSYYVEYDTYTENLTALQLGTLPTACNTSFYFNYSLDITGGGTAFNATARRCTASGKNPDYSSGNYNLNITANGTLDGTQGFI